MVSRTSGRMQYVFRLVFRYRRVRSPRRDRKSTRLNSSHQIISYAVFCLKKKKKVQHLEKVVERSAVIVPQAVRDGALSRGRQLMQSTDPRQRIGYLRLEANTCRESDRQM